MIFDDHGVPIWWIHTPTWTPGCCRAGTSSGSTRRSSSWRSTAWTGAWSAASTPSATPPTPTTCSSLANGDHLVGLTVTQSHVDTSAYGGSSDATVINAELQEVSPSGQLVWDWKSQDHIALAETGRWWPRADRPDGYDIVHWNSIEPGTATR